MKDKPRYRLYDDKGNDISHTIVQDNGDHLLLFLRGKLRYFKLQHSGDFIPNWSTMNEQERDEAIKALYQTS